MIYLICGVPGSGKTWVLSQFKNTVHYDQHFNTPRKIYSDKIIKMQRLNPFIDIVADCPLGISEIVSYIRAEGQDIEPVFIIAPPEVIATQYYRREGRPIPKQHLGRIATMVQRSKEYGSYCGTSDAVLQYLKERVRV